MQVAIGLGVCDVASVSDMKAVIESRDDDGHFCFSELGRKYLGLWQQDFRKEIHENRCHYFFRNVTHSGNGIASVFESPIESHFRDLLGGFRDCAAVLLLACRVRGFGPFPIRCINSVSALMSPNSLA